MRNVNRLLLVAVAVLSLATAVPAGAMGPDPSESAGQTYKDAVAAVKRWEYKKAITLLERVLKDNPRDADALNYMGYSHRKLGDYSGALTYYRRALEIEPDHKGANEYIGEAYLELKQPEKARTHLDRLARICGQDCEEYRDLKKALDAYLAMGRHG